MMNTLGDKNFAMRMRDFVDKRVLAVLERERPREIYGTVAAVDYAAMTAEVLLAGGEQPLAVRMPHSCQVTNVNQIVRIGGRRGNRYVAGLASAPVWAGAGGLSNGWSAGAVSPSYRRDALGRVLLRGSVSGGSGAAFTLPVGYRPSSTRTFGVHSAATVTITSAGVVTPAGSGAVHFDAISFDTL